MFVAYFLLNVVDTNSAWCFVIDDGSYKEIVFSDNKVIRN
jgi:hypothetical protein